MLFFSEICPINQAMGGRRFKEDTHVWIFGRYETGKIDGQAGTTIEFMI